MNKINPDIPGKKRINSRWPSSIAIFSLLTSILVSSCAVGPDFIRPEPPMPDMWHQELTSGLTTGEAGLETWWGNFNDPVLDNLIKRATDRNFDLAIAIERINEARALLGIAAGERFPDINGGGDATRTRFGEDFPPPSYDNKRTDYYYSTGLDAFWEIDFWGRVTRQIEAAEANLFASIESYRDVLVILYAEVALNYVELRTLQQRLSYAESNVEAQRETLKLTEDRLKAEIAPELDVEQAQLNLARTESTIPQLKERIVSTVNRLGVLLGVHPQSLHAELGAFAPIPEPPTTIIIGIPADILRQRPDIRQAERVLASQTARIGVATADLYPTFSLFGSMGFEATSDLFDSTNRYWSFGPQFNWNIFDGGRVRSRIQGADARAMQALNAYEQTVLLALEEVENSMVSYAQESNRRVILDRSVKAAQRSVELVRVLYITGLTDFQNLLDMERDVFEQQDIQAASQGRVSQNLIRLYKAMGGGWDNQTAQTNTSANTQTSANAPVKEQQEQDNRPGSQNRISPNLTRLYKAIGGGDNPSEQPGKTDNTKQGEQK